jgi:hypothetical protein
MRIVFDAYARKMREWSSGGAPNMMRAHQEGCACMDDGAVTRWIVGTIRAEMARQGVSYAELTTRLGRLGVEDNERNIRNKVARGTFSALFFMQCLAALGMSELKLDHPELRGTATKMAEPDLSHVPTMEEILAEVRKVLAESQEGSDAEDSKG